MQMTKLQVGLFEKKNTDELGQSTKVNSILVSYFINMRLNINGSFDVKTLTKPYMEFILYKKMDPLTLGLICTYKVNN